MKQEDQGLSDVNFEPLNEEFYSARPHEYFVMRLNSLILQAGRAEDVQRLLHEGVTYRELSLSSAPDHVHDPGDQDGLETYVALEAEVLYFHAIETLLRLYLAHEAQSVCPWLDLARVRTPGEFKKLVKSRFMNDQLSEVEKWEKLAPILIGIPASAYPHGSEHYLRVLGALESAMAAFAADFLGGAARHNSAKHGLAMRASHENLRVAGGVLSASGIAIKHLDIQGSPKRWHETTSWADVDMRMALIRIAAHLIEAIWDIARVRYTGAEGPVQVFLMDLDLHQFVSRGRPWSMDGFSLSLIYERPDGTYAERTGGLLVSVFDNPMSDEHRAQIAESISGSDAPDNDAPVM